ncbi:MAG: ABC transporter ATP-binding protein, partial [Oscillospiraceae bacterium]|nr:ABC transporter ATP-binding protein [Oscillospiraceae bacterium]
MDKKYTTTQLIKRFIPYFKPYKKTLFFDLFCALLTTVCEIVLPMIIRKITNTASYDITLLTVRMVLSLALLYFVLRIIDTFANYFMADMGHVMGAKIETDMRSCAYAHLQKLSATYFNNTKVGQIMGRITSDLFDITEFSHHCPEELFIAVIKITASFIILSQINLALTAMIFAFVPIMTVVCRAINKKMRAAFKRQRYQIGELNANIEDTLLGQKVVKAFANEDVEIGKFEAGNKEFLSIKKYCYNLMGLFQTSTRAFDGLMYLTVIVGGGLFLVYRKILPGDMVAYVMYVSTLISTIRRIIEFAEQFQRGMTGIERYLEIMDADIEIFDDKDAKDIVSPKGDIVFENVSFEYPDDHNEVFKNLNLSIKSGEKVAIVGPSGGGKTTLCNLIPRFYDTTGGKITLDGVDIKKITLKSLRKNIGIVQQDVYIFSGTIYENIAYGNIGATL